MFSPLLPRATVRGCLRLFLETLYLNKKLLEFCEFNLSADRSIFNFVSCVTRPRIFHKFLAIDCWPVTNLDATRVDETIKNLQQAPLPTDVGQCHFVH